MFIYALDLRFMNYPHTLSVIKKTLIRNGFSELADELLMAEVNAGEDKTAILKEICEKLENWRDEKYEAYDYIITESKALFRFYRKGVH